MKKLLHLTLALWLLAGWLVAARPVHAAAFTVNDTSDATDINPGNGECRSNLLGAARCTLRAAVMEANALPGPDTIVLPAGTYRLTRSGALDANANRGDLDILNDLTITGASPTTTIIDGNGSITGDRVFDILDDPAPSTNTHVTISDVTIRGGHASGNGGGIGMAMGQNLTLIDSLVTANVSDAGGGGILAQEETQVVIRNSTISGNSASGDGGGFLGLSFYEGGTSWTFINSTLSGNSAGGSGGGLFSGLQSGGPLGVGLATKLFNVTIANNSANAGQGGGLAGVSPELHNSIVAGNLDFGPLASQRPDCATTLSNASNFSLIQNATGCTIPGGMAGMVTGQSPLLGPLQGNGGPTPTHLIGAGPALDAGNPSGCRVTNGILLNLDQRGEPRHVGPGGVFGRCDMGAVEMGG